MTIILGLLLSEYCSVANRPRDLLGVPVWAGIMKTLASEIGEHFLISGVEVVSTVDARVGRPLTPVGAAGVARRTVRCCAVSFYNCSVPGIDNSDNLAGQAGTFLDLKNKYGKTLRSL